MYKPTKRWMEKKIDGYVTLFAGTTFNDTASVERWLRSAMLMAMRDASDHTLTLNAKPAERITGEPMEGRQVMLQQSIEDMPEQSE